MVSRRDKLVPVMERTRLLVPAATGCQLVPFQRATWLSAVVTLPSNVEVAAGP